MLSRKWGKEHSHLLLVGMGNTVVLLENNLTKSTSTKIHSICGLGIPLLESYPIETQTQHLRTYKQGLSINIVHSAVFVVEATSSREMVE